MFMQNLGEQTKSIMVFSEVAYWIPCCFALIQWIKLPPIWIRGLVSGDVLEW